VTSRQLPLRALRRRPVERIPVVPRVFAEPLVRRQFDVTCNPERDSRTTSYNPTLHLVDAQLAAHARFGFHQVVWMRVRPGPGESAVWADDWVLHHWEHTACNT
jgi:hypothetical protein